MKFNGVMSSASLATLMIGFSAASASAQFTIQSTGTLSGTIQMPSFNANFNNITTRIDTDSTGTYSRNIGSRNNPNLVPVYKSDYVKVATQNDGSLKYYVDFKGIPIVSFDGVLTSSILSGGQLTPYTYQGKLRNVTFDGIVQDEFGLARGFYTGVVTDPKTGQQYQGTFEVSGQGPRYSDRNGGDSPTVFDFKSDIPGKPSVTSLTMKNTPLVRLTIKVPANATLVTPNQNVNTNTPTPAVNGGSTSTPTPTTSNGDIPTTATITGTDSAISVLPSTDTTDAANSFVPSTEPNIEFSSGTVNSVIADSGLTRTNSCSQDRANCAGKSANSRRVGPQSRVLLR